MKFLIDAQLPQRMAQWFNAAGHDAIHTLDFLAQNRTSDLQITDTAAAEERVVVTKDSDFVDSHLLCRRPEKLLLISTGNMSNAQLAALVVPLIAEIAQELQAHDFLEVGHDGLILRD